jgi:hypothetical protein
MLPIDMSGRHRYPGGCPLDGLGVTLAAVGRAMRKDEFRWTSLDKHQRSWLEWKWLDEKLGVTTVTGFPIAALALAVLLQWLLILLQLFCRPCLRTIFE